MPEIVVLWTDAVLLAWHVWRAARQPLLRARWRKVFSDAPALCSTLLLVLFMGITLLDSLHFRSALPSVAGVKVAYDTRTQSVLNVLLQRTSSTRRHLFDAAGLPGLCQGKRRRPR